MKLIPLIALLTLVLFHSATECFAQTIDNSFAADEPANPIELTGGWAAKCETKSEPITDEVPVLVELSREVCDEPKTKFLLSYFVEYDKGIVLRPVDKEKHPFELKFNGWTQIRHIGFTRDNETFTDNTGTTRTIHNRNNFDIERARLVFSGFALTPKLSYFVQLDGDTDGRETVDFFDYFWTYQMTESFAIQFGKRKVPGSRQWILSARRTRLVDRPLANDFFRPDRTVGVFGVGDIAEKVHYEVMVGNGYRTSNRPASEINDRLAFSGTMYWDPLGDYGSELIDFGQSENPLVRIGHAITYASQSGRDRRPLGEADFVRLTDGTNLTATGALAPGVTVTDFDILLYSVDVGAKWKGFSANAEFFFRWLDRISGDGILPQDNLYQTGYYVEGGCFVIPKKLDFNVRYSEVDGLFGNHSEYAAGFSWFPLGTNRLKVTFDVTSLDGSPLNNTSSDILVGDDGFLFRTQVQAEF